MDDIQDAETEEDLLMLTREFGRLVHDAERLRDEIAQDYPEFEAIGD